MTGQPPPTTIPAAPKRPSLFQIGEEMQQLDRLLTDCGGDISDPAVEAHVTALAEKLADQEGKKLDGILWYMRQMEGREAAARAQADQLAELMHEYTAAANRERNGIERLMKLVKTHLENTGRTKATSEAGVSFAIQKNGGAPQLEYAPGLTPDQVPEEYTQKAMNRTAIIAALKAGRIVPGCELVPVTGTHLRIRV